MKTRQLTITLLQSATAYALLLNSVQLTKVERLALQAYTGLTDAGMPKRLKDMAKKLGVSKEEARTILTRAKSKLARELDRALNRLEDQHCI